MFKIKLTGVTKSTYKRNSDLFTVQITFMFTQVRIWCLNNNQNERVDPVI